MKKNWPIKILGELLTTLENGSRPRGGVSEISDGIPSFGGEHINRDGGFVWDNPKHVTRDFYTGMKRGRIQHRDILIVKDGATTGKVAVVRDNFPFREAAVNEHVFLLRTDKFKVLPEFVGYFLFGPLGQQQILSNFRGAAIGGIAQDFVRNVHVPVPPLAEQERIVKLLDEADELRKLRAQADHRTADLIPALFHEMFGDLTTNPKQWPLKMLGDITRIDAPMVDPRLEEYLDLPHVGPERIESGTGKILPTKTAREDDLISGKFLFDGRHVLYSKIRPYLRKVALPAFRGLCSADVYPVTPVQSEICREYLWIVLLSECFTKYTAGHRERANIPKVNREQFSAYQCPLPPLSLQKEFAQRVTEIRQMEAEQAACRSRLDALFQSLLHRAFAGEL